MEETECHGANQGQPVIRYIITPYLYVRYVQSGDVAGEKGCMLEMWRTMGEPRPNRVAGIARAVTREGATFVCALTSTCAAL